MNFRKLTQVLTVAHLFAITPLDADAAAPNMEIDAIKKVIEVYFKGHATGDGAHFLGAFLDTAHIEGIRENGFTSWTLQAYASNFNGKPAADEGTRRRTIDTVDVTGDAAMVKATLQHGQITFTDYFVMLKVNGAWKIANKVYHMQRH
jgi:hypothetical protein